MRPTVTGRSASPPGRGGSSGGGRLAGRFGLATLDDLPHGVRRLRAATDPVLDAVERDAVLGLVLGGLGIVEADALDEAPVAWHARVGDDDVVEGAVLGSAAGHANDDHLCVSFPVDNGQ